MIQNATSMSSICTNCSYQTCICPVGLWNVTSLCTNVVGCIAAVK